MMKQPDEILRIMQSSRALCCVECGRCVAVCPMNEMYGNFSIEMSPRGVIRTTVMGSAILEDACLWYCTECNAGTEVCPEGVSCRDLIRGLRHLAIEQGAAGDLRACRACGERFVVARVADYVSARLTGEPQSFLELCPACRRRVYLLRNAYY